MKTKTANRKLKIVLWAMLIFLVYFAFSLTTFAYFNFRKVYNSTGDLPILNIEYNVNTGSVASLKNIQYYGQNSENLKVTINTNGNNMKGKVRVKATIVWTGYLNNTPTYNQENVFACSLNIDDSVWEKDENGYIYLRGEGMLPNTEITVFDGVSFFENLSMFEDYNGQSVSIYIIAEIYQTANLPEGW